MPVSLGFDLGKSRSSSSLRGDTGFSSVYKGRIRLDPSIRGIQDEILRNLQDVRGFTTENLNDFLARSRGLRQRFEGNRGALLQARINPVLQSSARRIGRTQQRLGTRRLGGSSFADIALADEERRTARELGEATALGEMETLQALTGLDQGTIDTVFRNAQIQALLNGESMEVANQRAMIELQALGLGERRGTGSQLGLQLNLSSRDRQQGGIG